MSNDTTFVNGVTLSDAGWFNDINDHIYNNTPISPATTVHPASVIANTPSGGISSTTVQTALNELDTEKANATNAVLITPDLGTPSAVVLTNATGTAANLTAGYVTTNANLTGPVTSVGNATAIADGAIGVTKIGGTSTYIPYFDATGFMGTDSAFTFNDTTKTLSVLTFAPSAGTTTVAPIILTPGTNLTSVLAGAEEFDGAAFYKTSDTTGGRAVEDRWQYFRLTANGSTISTIADYFGATGSGVPTVLNGVYEIEWHCDFLKSTAGTVTWTIVNTQTVTNMVAEWVGNVITGIAATGAMSMAGVVTQTSASVALPVTGTLSDATNHKYIIRAVIEAGTAGNVRLRATASAGSITPLRDSYFKVRRLPAGNAGTFAT